ncbi:hypothetical protein FWF48_01165 [Candidatus Saccharibacteria bacterium]|nr:hypothetical protein [Candidatus Saccharibacteria bacterium]
MVTGYYNNRHEAGELLANELFDKYRYEDMAVVALNDGGVEVGEAISNRLHAILTMVVAETITLPGDPLEIGSVAQGGNFVYNNQLAQVEIDEYEGEFHNYLEDEKRNANAKINRLMGDGGAFDRDLLIDRAIILVADGLENGSLIGAAMDYLKPVRTKRIIVALPIATVPVVDFVHLKADEVHILDVKADYMGTDHYYEDNNMPSHEEIINKLNQNILNWR